MNKKVLGVLFALFVVFTVSLSENLQIADGFLSQSTAGWVYEMSPGESQVLTWTLTNTEEESIIIEFRGEGEGSELFVFEELVTVESKEKRSFEFIVIVPEDHPDNIEYRPVLYALEKAIPDSEGGSAVLINYQMSAKPVIKIGDNPVFTPEAIPIIEEIIPEPVVKERPTEEEFSLTPEETLEEKLARIAEANKGSKVDDVFEEAAPTGQFEVQDPVSDYLPEPISETASITVGDDYVVISQECGFIDWILSIFGIGKC